VLDGQLRQLSSHEEELAKRMREEQVSLEKDCLRYRSGRQ